MKQPRLETLQSGAPDWLGFHLDAVLYMNEIEEKNRQLRKWLSVEHGHNNAPFPGCEVCELLEDTQ